ncbi:hypothetical protein [Trinickia dinghuensis]|nr:hypothetical protein [Trinickia dinghuensis]
MMGFLAEAQRFEQPHAGGIPWVDRRDDSSVTPAVISGEGLSSTQEA